MKRSFVTKRIFSGLLLILILLGTVGCKSNTQSSFEGVPVRIASLKGPTSIGLVKLYADSDAKETKNTYDYSICGAADEISAGIIKGEYDVAAVPANLASILYKKTEGAIQIAAINTLGVLYICTLNEDIDSVSDLKGKTIYTTGQGTTPEYSLRAMLSASGMNPDEDVNIVFCSEASEVVAQLGTMDQAIVMLPQPYVTVAQSKVEGLKVALSLTKEWEAQGNTLITGVVIARKEFIEKNPEQFAEFLDAYEASVSYANTEVAATADLCESFDIFKAAIAKKAIPECNICFITGSEMQNKVTDYLKILFEENPSAVGGSLPDAGAFYLK